MVANLPSVRFALFGGNVSIGWGGLKISEIVILVDERNKQSDRGWFYSDFYIRKIERESL